MVFAESLHLQRTNFSKLLVQTFGLYIQDNTIHHEGPNPYQKDHDDLPHRISNPLLIDMHDLSADGQCLQMVSDYNFFSSFVAEFAYICNISLRSVILLELRSYKNNVSVKVLKKNIYRNTNSNLKVCQFLHVHMKITCGRLDIKTPFTFQDMHT